MGLVIKVLMQKAKKFFFGEEKKTPKQEVKEIKPKKKPKKEQTQPEIQKRETTIEIKPMSGDTFLKRMKAPPVKEKRRNRCNVEETAVPRKKDNKEEAKKQSKLAFMERRAGVLSALAKNGAIQLNRNTYFGKLRGRSATKYAARELKRSGIEVRADIGNLRITVSPETQAQIKEIQGSF